MTGAPVRQADAVRQAVALGRPVWSIGLDGPVYEALVATAIGADPVLVRSHGKTVLRNARTHVSRRPPSHAL